MDHSKRKNIYIIIFVVTTIIAASVAVYFGITKADVKDDLQIANKDMEDYKSQLEEAKSSINKGEVTVPKTEEKVVEKVVEKIVEKSTPVGFNKDKCINPTEGATYAADTGENGNDIDSLIVDGSGNVNIRFNTQVKEIFKDFNGGAKVPTNTNIAIKGFSSKPVEAFYATTGQSIDGCVILFLMEDGTVEYMPYVKSVLSGNIKSYGKVPGVNSVVKFVQGGVGYSENGQPSSGARGVFAINNKGQFYDLGRIFSENRLLD